jgi:neurofibromin 1
MLQPRAFAALGVLHIRDLDGQSQVTDELVGECLQLLREALGSQGAAQDLPVAIILCLARLYEQLPAGSRFSPALFWLAIALIQLPEVKLFAAALTLLEAILRTLDYADGALPEGVELSQLVMGNRTGALDVQLARIDHLTGISFRSSFSFAVAAHLLKGLKESSTKTATLRLLSLFLDVGAKKSIGPHLLGYLGALLPGKGSDEQEALAAALLSGTADTSSAAAASAGAGTGPSPAEGAGGAAAAPRQVRLRPHACFFAEQLQLDHSSAALLFTLLATMLQNNNLEHEQLFIFEALREGAARMPDAFAVCQESLISKMAAVVEKGQHPALVNAVLAMMGIMFRHDKEKEKEKERRQAGRAAMEALGFAGLQSMISPDDSFRNQPLYLKREQLLTAITALIEVILETRPAA